MAKESGDYRQIMKQICQVVKGPVSAEVVATDTAGMVREGRDLASIDEHIVVKVPFTRDGVKACKTLAGEGIRVNVTLIFSATQASTAAILASRLFTFFCFSCSIQHWPRAISIEEGGTSWVRLSTAD